MRHAFALCTLFVLVPVSSAWADNFDFSQGTLRNWQGSGFQITKETGTGTNTKYAVSSSDALNLTRRGELRYRLRIPAGADTIRFRAFAHTPGTDNARVNVLLHVENEVIAKEVHKGDMWVPVDDGPLPRTESWQEYRWPVGPLVGKVAEVVLIDEDERTECYLYCSGFKIYAAESDGQGMLPELQLLQKKHKLAPFKVYQSTYFQAYSNADNDYTAHRLRNCDQLYRGFFEHFQKYGFALRQPRSKLNVVIFDSHVGMEAYLGNNLPFQVTGVYRRDKHVLVLYDQRNNRELVGRKNEALAHADNAFFELERRRIVGAIEQTAQEIGRDLSISTAAHEGAHHLSFSSGMLNRYGDVPLWLCEGIACYCESTQYGMWEGIGQVNPMRLFDFAQAMHRGQALIPLRELLVNDTWATDSKRAILGYSQSWGLFYWLMKTQPQAMRAYLERIHGQRTPDRRLEDFEAAFGSNLQQIETGYIRYLRDLADQHK